MWTLIRVNNLFGLQVSDMSLTLICCRSSFVSTYHTCHMMIAISYEPMRCFFVHTYPPIIMHLTLLATARNANSLVPGAAMHIMSQRKTLLKIAKDTAREWYSEQVESIQHWLQTNGYYDKEITKNIDNFDVVPVRRKLCRVLPSVCIRFRHIS